MAARIDAYRLDALTRDNALIVIERALGSAGSRTAWETACRAAGVPDHSNMGPAQLTAAIEQLSKQQGVAGIIGNSLWIRLKTYELLSRRENVLASGRRR